MSTFSSFLRIWSHFLKKSLMENFIFCAVFVVRLQTRKPETFIRAKFKLWWCSKDHYRKHSNRFAYLSYQDQICWTTHKKCCWNRFCELAKPAMHTEFKQRQSNNILPSKYLTIYSINICQCYSKQHYYLYIAPIQTNSLNYFYYTKI